jgi:WD40 repeat protein
LGGSPKYFLSHAGEDRDVALALAQGLQSAGVAVWCDVLPGALEAGVPWTIQLERALKDASGYIIVVGERGIDRWVRAELDFALQRHALDPDFRIVPVLLDVDPGELPAFVQRFHAIRLGENEGGSNTEGIAAVLREAVEPDTSFDSACPFPGLEVLDEDNARFFFGREEETRALCRCLGRASGTHSRWVQIDGPSGAGKSSLARVGLIPAVRRGWLEGAPSSWRIAMFRPGSDPVLNLAECLARALAVSLDACNERLAGSSDGLRNLLREGTPAKHGFLLVVDQLEEVFTLSSETGRKALDALIAAALADRDGPLYLVTTIRADFVVRFPELPMLQDALNEHAKRYYVKPMAPDALRRAILGPARLAGLHLEDRLASRLVDDARKAKGALPLLAHVLQALWMRRDGNLLTHGAYDDLGELGGALAKSADNLLDSLGSARDEAINLLVQLVQVGRGTEDTRRTVPRSRLLSCVARDAESLLARLSGGRDPNAPVDAPPPPRLVTVGEDGQVDLVHEELIRQWTTLQRRVDAERRELERREDLDTAARLWNDGERRDGALPRGKQLAYYDSIAPTNDVAAEFLAAARAHEKRRERRRRAIGMGIAAALVAVIALWIHFENERIKDREEFARAATRAAEVLASTSRGAQARVLAGDPELGFQALKLGVEAVGFELRRDRVPRAEARIGLDEALTAASGSIPLRGHTEMVVHASFSPDGSRVVTASGDRMARIWRVADGKPLTTLRGHDGLVFSARYSPDGLRVLTVGGDRTARMWDAVDGKLLYTCTGQEGGVDGAEFSPDGERILTVGGDRTVRLRSTTTGSPLQTLGGHDKPVVRAGFLQGGARVASVDQELTIRVWESGSGELLHTWKVHEMTAKHAVFSPDGHRVLTIGPRGIARLWSTVDGAVHHALSARDVRVSGATFSPDGKRIVSIDGSKTMHLWDSSTGQLLQTLNQHEEPVSSFRFSPDGSRVVTASLDKTARVWRAKDGELLRTLVGHDRAVNYAAFSPDGTRIVTASWDETARVWGTADGKLLRTLHGHTGYARTASFAPDDSRIVSVASSGALLWNSANGRLLQDMSDDGHRVVCAAFVQDRERIVTVGDKGSIRTWSLADGRLLQSTPERKERAPGPLVRPDAIVLRAAVSPDGELIVTVEGRKVARLRRAADGILLHTLEVEASRLVDVALSPNADRVIGVLGDGSVRIWSAANGRLIHSSQSSDGRVVRATFSPDRTRFLTTSGSSSAQIWSTNDGAHLHTLAGNHMGVSAATFSPHAELAVTSGADKTAKIWRVADGKLVHTLIGHSHRVRHAAFSHDAARVVSASSDNTARIWSVASGMLLHRLSGHDRPVSHAEFSHDGRLVVTACEDGKIRVFAVSTRTILRRAVEVLRWQPEWNELDPELRPWLEDEILD